MLDAFLVPEKTVVTAKGDSEALDISAASNPVFLLTLSVHEVVEQESIEITLFTSADGADLGSKACRDRCRRSSTSASIPCWWI